MSRNGNYLYISTSSGLWDYQIDPTAGTLTLVNRRMDGAVAPGRKRRVFRRVEEKLRIVKLTLEPGASVAGIALANGVNANQVFRWKRQ